MTKISRNMRGLGCDGRVRYANSGRGDGEAC